jgi:hypothetical protein
LDKTADEVRIAEVKDLRRQKAVDRIGMFLRTLGKQKKWTLMGLRLKPVGYTEEWPVSEFLRMEKRFRR